MGQLCTLTTQPKSHVLQERMGFTSTSRGYDWPHWLPVLYRSLPHGHGLGFLALFGQVLKGLDLHDAVWAQESASGRVVQDVLALDVLEERLDVVGQVDAVLRADLQSSAPGGRTGVSMAL